MKVLVYGGGGQLGAACVAHFKSLGFATVSIDFAECKIADRNVLLKMGESFVTQGEQVREALAAERGTFSLVFNAAGGWAGGSASSKSFLSAAQRMIGMCLESSFVCAAIAADAIKPDGLVVFTGAAAATSATPGMVAYGAVKAATHHIVSSLAADESFHATVAAILPVTLDTASNRAGMPGADTSTWTPMSEVASLLERWIAVHPENGGLYLLQTRGGRTEVVKQ